MLWGSFTDLLSHQRVHGSSTKHVSGSQHILASIWIMQNCSHTWPLVLHRGCITSCNKVQSCKTPTKGYMGWWWCKHQSEQVLTDGTIEQVRKRINHIFTIHPINRTLTIMDNTKTRICFSSVRCHWRCKNYHSINEHQKANYCQIVSLYWVAVSEYRTLQGILKT